MIKKITVLLFFSTYSILASAMFCPNNFNEISIGDTIAQVQQQCGKPDGQRTIKSEDTSGPQEWSYYVSQNLTGTYPNGQQNASIKMLVAFNNNKVINITANAMSMTSTSLCGGTISAGDTMDKVKSICGKPIFINKNADQSAKVIETTEFYYQSNPPANLIFVEGKLTEKK